MKVKNIFYIIIGIIVIMIFNFFIINKYFDSWEVRGQFGDSFGGITALFSSLAFAGLIYTIYLQRNELQLQREELKLQREEMTKSREQLSKQVAILKTQLGAEVVKMMVSAHEMEVEAILLESAKTSNKEFFIKSIREEKVKIVKLATELNKLHKAVIDV